MSATTSYGTWVNHGAGEIDLETCVVVGLGDAVDDFDVAGLTMAYLNAINEQLEQTGTGVVLAGNEFYGPYPRTDGAEQVIAEAVEAVDFWELADRFDRSGTSAAS